MNRQTGLNYYSEEYLTMFYNILYKMIRDMTQAKLNNSISHNFISQMIPHHRAAVEMSRNILQYTSNKQLRRIASNIITEQTQSIQNMQRIMNTCAKRINNKAQLGRYNKNASDILHTMFSAMESSEATNRLNCDFLSEMIPHHKGAVQMSENALDFDICPELIPIVKTVITSQKNGIEQMKILSARLRCNN